MKDFGSECFRKEWQRQQCLVVNEEIPKREPENAGIDTVKTFLKLEEWQASL
jgi:hypothetical protein